MNRRDLFRRMGGAAIGAVLAAIGIRPKKAEAVSDWTHAPPYTFALHDQGNGPLRLYLTDRFYVDLPDRYVDTVCVDYAIAKEWENSYDAECRVCPRLGDPWEVLPMKRVEEVLDVR